MTKVDTSMLLPRGIRVRGNSLVVQTRKQVVHNGKVNTVSDFKSVKMKLPKNHTAVEYTEAFLVALEEAKREKLLAHKHIATHGLEVKTKVRAGAVPTLKEIFDTVFNVRWKNTPQEENVLIYEKDIFAFFPKDIRLDEMQTHDNYDNFVAFMQKRIIERKANNLSTFSTRTTNRRLSVIRCCIAHAIDKGLMDYSKVLSPNPTHKHYGWRNLKEVQIAKKNTLTKEQEHKVIAKAQELGDFIFAHAYAWLIDTGMRYETEFFKWNLKNINFKNWTITWHRNKTGNDTENMPLTKRCIEIIKNYKTVAMQRKDQRVFADLSKHALEDKFRKYAKLCKIKDHTPYITRRTFCTRLGERGVHPAIIMDMAGHTCVETSAKYYIKSTDVAKKRAMKTYQMSDEEFDGEEDRKSTMIGHNSKNK